MSSDIRVVSTNLSREKGTKKQPVDGVTVDEHGIVGDAHAGAWHRQVSLLGHEDIEAFASANDIPISPGDCAENLTISGLDFSQISVLDRLQIGDVELQVTQIGKDCHGDDCGIYRQLGECIMPHLGVFTRVLRTGKIDPGDPVDYLPYTLTCKVITLSDRASQGEYTDRSGPRIGELLRHYFEDTRWRLEIESDVIADEAPILKTRLQQARESGIDVVVTTGGTGVGPRDITPDVVGDFCEKTVPGIMEMIRVKYGADNPRALLSRSVAGVSGGMLIYTLPGSVTAVEEYMSEILLTFEHLLLTAKGLDVH